MAETGFLRPLPESHSSTAVVRAERSTLFGEGFRVFANADADVNFNLFQEDFAGGGFAGATGSATIDFTLNSPHYFTVSGLPQDPVYDPEVSATSAVNLIRLVDDSLVDPLSETVLTPGSYRFLTSIELSINPELESFEPPVSYFGEAAGSVLVNPSLSLTAVPEPSASVLVWLLASCGLSLRRRNQSYLVI